MELYTPTIQAKPAASVATPDAGKVTLFADSANKHISQKDDTGTVIDLAAGGGGGLTDADRASIQSNAIAMANAYPTYLF